MEKYIEDIRYLINKLESIHPDLYNKIEKKEIEKLILDLQKNNKEITDNQFVYFIKLLLKLINDPHTLCLNHHQKIFPLQLKIIDNKVYIINTDANYSRYKFYEIIAINNIQISKVIEELEKIITYQNQEWLFSELESELIREETLKSLPIFQNLENQGTIYTLQKIDSVEQLRFYPQDTYLYDHIIDKCYWYDYDAEKNILIINYKKCKEEENYSFEKFMEEIDEFIKSRDVKDVIVDIRGNTGGNSSIILPLIEYLEKGFNITTVVNNSVFSSGCMALNHLKNIGSKTVGTGIGTPFNHFGNCENFYLPNTNLKIYCSSKYWYYYNGKISSLNKENYQMIVPDNKWLLEDVIFIPEVYIESKIEDYEVGYDRPLETAKTLLVNSKKR